MYNTILFDLDGTLTDSADGIAQSAQYALHTLGIEEPDLNKLRSFAGPPLHSYFMEYAHLDTGEANRAVAAFREHYAREGMYVNSVYPLIPELMLALRRSGYSLAVVTSKETSQAIRVLQQFNLARFFDIVTGCSPDDTNQSKAALIEKTLVALRKTQDRQNVVMVGDRFYDIEGAKAAGVTPVGCAYGYGTYEELSRSGANYIAKDVQELGNMLLSLRRMQAAYPQGAGVRAQAPGRPVKKETTTGQHIWRMIYPVLIWFGISNLVSAIGGGIYGAIKVFGYMSSGLDMSDSQQVYSLIMGDLAGSNLYTLEMALSGVADLILIPIFYAMHKKDVLARTGKKITLKTERKPGVSNSVLALVMGFSVSVVLNVLIAITGIAEWMYKMNPERYDMLSSLPVWAEFIIICLLAPVVEELLFRAVVFRRMREWTGFYPAALISAAIFGIVHFDITTGICAFIIGVIMAMMLEYTGSIFLSMFFHFGFNFYSVAMDLIGIDNMPEETAGYVLLGLLVVCIVLTVITMMLFLKKNRPEKNPNP